MSKGLYEELYDYATLEAAYEAAFLYLDDAPEDSEAWLINLQNHLVWRSYEPGQTQMRIASSSPQSATF